MVSASDSRSPVAIRMAASSVVNAIAMCGVRRSASTRPNGLGTMPRRDMPYTSRLAMIMLIRAPLATASSAMPENSLSGMSSGPWRTTSSSGPSDPAEIVRGHDHRGGEGDQQVDDAGHRRCR